MKKISAFLLTLLMVMMLFTSCDGSSAGDSYSNDSYKSESASGSVSDSVNDSETPAEDADDIERKVIKTYNIRMESLEYDKAVDLIVSATEEFGGYIATATQDGTGVNENRKRSASYTVRIPSASADAYIERIAVGNNVLSSRLTTEDVTDSYYNVKSRLDSLVVQEERLMEMLNEAQYLDEMIRLEDKLSEVRAEINELHIKIQLMDKSVDYSYIYITLNEVVEYVEPEKETYFARLSASVVDAFESFVKVVGEIVIIFIWLLPYILVILAIMISLVHIDKRQKRRKKEKQQKEQEAQNERNENK